MYLHESLVASSLSWILINEISAECALYYSFIITLCQKMSRALEAQRSVYQGIYLMYVSDSGHNILSNFTVMTVLLKLCVLALWDLM